MVTEQVRYDSQHADDLQDVVVQKLPGQARESVYNESRGRGLSFAAVRVHNNHIQTWRAWGSPKPGQQGIEPNDRDDLVGDPVRYTQGCRICSEGLEGILAPLASRAPTVEVVTRRRTDRERAAALARDSGTDQRENPLLWQ